jgi:hypothetical protein
LDHDDVARTSQMQNRIEENFRCTIICESQQLHLSPLLRPATLPLVHRRRVVTGFVGCANRSGGGRTRGLKGDQESIRRCRRAGGVRGIASASMTTQIRRIRRIHRRDAIQEKFHAVRHFVHSARQKNGHWTLHLGNVAADAVGCKDPPLFNYAFLKWTADPGVTEMCDADISGIDMARVGMLETECFRKHTSK